MNHSFNTHNATTQAFKCLRGHARLLLGLLDLMVDANLKDLCPNPTPAAAAAAAAAASSSAPTTASGVGGSICGQSVTGSLSVSLSQTPSPLSSSQQQQQQVQQEHTEAARVLARIERRFRLDLGEEDEEALERHFVGLIHKALGALGPQVVEVLHNLAVITK
jgi:hypothetical protein